MDPVTDLAIPAVAFLMMVAVGHGLTPSELCRSATDLRAVVTATIGQLVLLPLIATVIALVLEPSPVAVAGLVLVASCPGGTVSNFYTCLARGNVALSITLTAVSCLVSFATIPALVTAGFFFWLDDQPEIRIPGAVLAVQLLGLVVLPAIVGMTLRRWRPATLQSRDRALRRVSLVALVALVAYVVHGQKGAIVASIDELALTAFVFTALAMAAGAGLAWATGRPAADRVTYLVEFPCRNLALATVVAVSLLHRPDIVGFAVVLLLVQALIMLTAALFLGTGEAQA
ncbi:MAG: bile acid:sodium symporter [Thermoanaerobaculales bacterium]|jgi:BASS family bile acid:Na+ symporter|nr:bile acid:sodium symporter [Thermoanaerobaculales bacterium]